MFISCKKFPKSTRVAFADLTSENFFKIAREVPFLLVCTNF